MASTSITRTPGATTATDAWTFSVWVKRGSLGVSQDICSGRNNTDGGNNQSTFEFDGNDNLWYDAYNGGTIVVKNITNRKFRDIGAWYHIVLDFDSSTAGSRSAADRMKIWVNGVRETAFSTETQSGVDQETNFCQQNDCPLVIGGDAGASRTPNYNGVMSHINYVAGVGHPASVFGEFDATSGIWKPNVAPSVTYGTNGFLLNMETRTNLDLDSSPNAYTFTTAGTLTATYDNPSNNFTTLNILDPMGVSSPTFSNGNTTYVQDASKYYPATGTMGLTTGKWYWEVSAISGADQIQGISGDANSGANMTGASNQPLGFTDQQWGYTADNGKIYNNNTYTTYGNTYGTEIIGNYLDLDNNKLYFAKGGVIQNSGTGVSITAAASTDAGYYVLGNSYWAASSPAFNFNFGNGYFGTTEVTSAVADAGGIGAFEYDPSDGGSASFDSSAKDFRAICTKNIGTYG